MLVALCVGLLAFGQDQDRGSIEVEVDYTGSGKVHAGHKIYVGVFEFPDLESGPPVGVKSIDAKNGRLTFSNLPSSSRYYVFATHASRSDYDASELPPSGSSLGVYSVEPPKPAPVEVAPGKTTSVKLTFDDSNKIP